MCLFKVIIFLLIVSTVVVDGRALRKRRQEARSSAYYGANGMALYPYLNFILGNNLYPIGSNWYVPGPPRPYNYPFGYGVPNYGYNNYGNNQYGSYGLNLLYNNDEQPYTGQSYVPLFNEWLPLPGRDRRRRRQLSENVIAPKSDNSPVLSTIK